MLSKLVLFTALFGAVAACNVKWPNNTDTGIHWFPSCSGAITFFDLKPFDAHGNAEYPVVLTAPLVMEVSLNNPTHTYTAGNLKQTLKLWSWGGWGGCQWSEVPTLGLLKDLDACSNGVPCPVKPGKQTLKVTLDFSKFGSIIKLLKDDSPYQLEMILADTVSGDQSCITSQARSRTH